MKKLLLSALALCMALFVSCSKNSDSAASSGDSGGGVTSKRIYEIYKGWKTTTYCLNDDGQTWDLVSEHEYPYELDHIYHWDGNKIIAMDDYSNGVLGKVRTFEYNDAGLVSKTTYNNSSTIFSYNSNSQINKLEFYRINYDGEEILTTVQEIIYNGDKPVRINSIDYDYNSKDDDSSYAIITWTGDNITKWDSYRNNKHSYSILTYDNKHNNYFGGNALTAHAWISSRAYLSVNNLISGRSFDDDNVNTYTATYTYEYDSDNFPVEKYCRIEEIGVGQYGKLRKYVDEKHYTYTYLND